MAARTTQTEHCRVTRWARSVVNGDVIACELVTLACQRHLRDLETAADRGLYWDVQAAEHPLDFFAFLVHSKGKWAGQQFELADWQAFLVGSIFGWKRAETGLRRYSIAYVEVPRKNGKSTLAAGVGLYLLIADGEPGAEVYAAATTRDQAKIVWAEAARMVKASPWLREHVTVLTANMHVQTTHSKFEPLGAAEDSLDGLNPHACIIDELHAHKNRKIWDVLDTATGAREQPLQFAITTAGHDRNSVCWEQHEYAEKVLRGIIEDDSYFAFVTGIDKGDDWRDPIAWRKANPNWGVSVNVEDFERKARRAEQMPAMQNQFLQKRLNVWTEQATRWINMLNWDACVGPVPWQEMPDKLDGRECFVGLDLADTQDIAACVLIFKDGDGCYDLIPRFWVPESKVLELTKKGQNHYDVWQKAGALTMTDGAVIDYDVIRAEIKELGQRYEIKEIGFDPWNATQIATQLGSDGFICVKVRQGHASMGEPTKKFGDLLIEQKIRHGGHPVLRWMASNMVVRKDANGNICPDKEKAAQKIDGIVAAIIALSRAIVQPEETGSVYDDGQEVMVI